MPRHQPVWKGHEPYPVNATPSPETLKTRHESVWKLELIIGEEGADGAKFIETYKETVHLRNLFYASARSDLGVRSGDLPQPTFGSLRLRE
jgi:hypothetical protein